MGHKKDKDTNEKEYRFINETIKKEPLDKRKIVRRIASIVGSGILFGCCASAACVGMFPVFIEQFGIATTQDTALRIVTPSPDVGKDAAANTGDAAEKTVSVVDANPLDNYEAIYSEVLKVSEKPRKALVTMKGLSQDQDMLDDTQLSYNSSQGIIFLETDAELYILTYGDRFNDIHDLEVTFADGTTAVAQICKEDRQTGLLVACVNKSQISEETIRKLYVVDLGASNKMPENSPVIAIGSPSGDKDAVVYGIITSVTGRVQMADTEYNILATDMHGHPDGSGVLLDLSGNVVGIIIKQDSDSTETVRAYPVSQIRTLVENMTNKRAVNYTGIYGTSITSAQSDRLHIPTGVYIDKVEDNSPARAAGIQNGDIIIAVNDTEVKDMLTYHTILQKADANQLLQVTISRNISGGKNVEMDFKVKIEER